MIDAVYIKFYVGIKIRFYTTSLRFIFYFQVRIKKLKEKGIENSYAPKKKQSVKIVATAIAAIIPAIAPSYDLAFAVPSVVHLTHSK